MTCPNCGTDLTDILKTAFDDELVGALTDCSKHSKEEIEEDGE